MMTDGWDAPLIRMTGNRFSCWLVQERDDPSDEDACTGEPKHKVNILHNLLFGGHDYDITSSYASLGNRFVPNTD